MNLSMLLDMTAEAFGDRTSVVCGDQSLTFAQVRARAQNAAALFKASGASHVALLDINGPILPVAIFGAAYADIPYVPLNYRLTNEELNELVDRVAPAVLVVGDAYRDLITPRDDIQLLSPEEVLNAPATEEELFPMAEPDAVGVQLFTSGTTGKPKAALLKHENLVSYILGTIEFGSAEEGDAVLVTVPPYHIAGIAAVLSSSYAARRMVQLEAFDAAAWLDAARAENVTNAFLVPTMLTRLIEHVDESGGEANCPSLNAIAYGGGKMPLTTIRRAMELLPQVNFTNAYGLTETSSTVCILTPDDHRAAMESDDAQIARRLISVGQATGAIEIAIRDDAGNDLGTDEAGMIYVRGGQVAGEYKEQGSQLDADGWFCTKDIGYLDSEGYLFLDGRADDVIVRGGENISPGEIEDVLLQHDAVRDVAVVAVPDEQWGEGVAAAVVLQPGKSVEISELQESVKTALRSSRVPQRIEFRDELPYNELGKVLRRIIRAEFAESA